MLDKLDSIISDSIAEEILLRWLVIAEEIWLGKVEATSDKGGARVGTDEGWSGSDFLFYSTYAR